MRPEAEEIRQLGNLVEALRRNAELRGGKGAVYLSLIHISEPTRPY